MSGVWGDNIKLAIFGESHGKAIGITISGLAPGIGLDLDFIRREIQRRTPGRSALATARKEDDEFEIVSGYFQNKTTGAPLCLLIWNNDQRSGDYEELKYTPRPGHADFTAFHKYDGCNDYRGGGHFSGRLTAPLVLAGAIAKQILAQRGIVIGSHIVRIGGVQDELFGPVAISPEILRDLTRKEFPVLDEERGKVMQEKILEAKLEQDSVGGVVETAVVGLPVGLGSPFFDSVESKIAHLVFAIPAVKGIEFGAGFKLAEKKGSEGNDPFICQEGQVKTLTNNNGGIQGGITNGMPVLFRTAIKPTSSIGKKQRTVNLVTLEEAELAIKGRHDPCIVPRAVPVLEAVAALALMDLMIEKDGISWMN